MTNTKMETSNLRDKSSNADRVVMNVIQSTLKNARGVLQDFIWMLMFAKNVEKIVMCVSTRMSVQNAGLIPTIMEMGHAKDVKENVRHVALMILKFA